MASELIEAAKEIVKSPKLSFSVALTAGLILAVSLPDFLGLDSFRDEYRKWIGLVCLFALSTGIIEIVSQIFAQFQKYQEKRRVENEALLHLDALTWNENSLLYHAIIQNSQTFDCEVTYNFAAGLVAKGLAIEVKDGANGYNRKLYFIPHFVWKEINNELAKNKIRQRDAGMKNL